MIPYDVLESCFLLNLRKILLHWLIEALERKINSFKCEVKTCKDSTRSMILECYMESLNLNLRKVPTTIPLSVGSRVARVDVQNCSYFSSASIVEEK